MAENILASLEIVGSEKAKSEISDIAKDLDKAAESSRKFNKEQKELNKTETESIGIIQKLKNNLDELEKKRNSSNSVREIRAFTKEIQQQQKELEKLTSVTTNFGSNLKQVFLSGAAAFGGFLAGQTIASTLQGAFEGLINREKIETSFEVLIGNAEEAREALSGLASFAKTTPFELEQVTDAGRRLLAFGFQAGELETRLRTLGNISSAVDIPINELASIFGKAAVQGRLFAEDINQLIERGIPVLEPLAKRLGVTVEQLKKQVELGNVSFRDLDAVFTELTTNGGRFAGMTERLGQTLGGRLSTLKDEFSAALIDTLEQILPLIELVIGSLQILVTGIGAVVGSLTNLRESFSQNYLTMTSMGVLLGTLTVAKVRAATAALALSENITFAEAASRRWNDTLKALRGSLLLNPYVLAAAAIAGIGYALNEYIKAADSANLTTEELKESSQNLANTINNNVAEATAKEIGSLDILINRIKDTNLSMADRSEALKELQRLYPSYFSGMSIEQFNVDALTSSYLLLKNSILEGAQARALTDILQKSFKEGSVAAEEYRLRLEQLRAGQKQDISFVDRLIPSTAQLNSVQEIADKELQDLDRLLNARNNLINADEKLNKLKRESTDLSGKDKSAKEEEIKLLQARRAELVFETREARNAVALAENTERIGLLGASTRVLRDKQAVESREELLKSTDTLLSALGSAQERNINLTSSIVGTTKVQDKLNVSNTVVAKSYDGLKLKIDDVSKAFENLSEKTDQGFRDLERQRRSRVSGGNLVEEAIIGSEADREKSLLEIDKTFKDANDRIVKSLSDQKSRIEEERKKINEADFKGDRSSALALLSAQERKLESDALRAQDNLLKERNAQEDKSLSLLSLQRIERFEKLNQDLNKTLREKSLSSLSETNKAINFFLTKSLESSRGKQLEDYYDMLLSSSLAPINEAIDRLRGERVALENKLAGIDPSDSLARSATQSLINKTIQDELDLERSAVAETTKIRLEANERKLKLEQDASFRRQELMRREQDNIRRIFDGAFVRTGNQDVDRIQGSLFQVGEDLFNALGVFSNAKQRELQIMRDIELEKQKILRDSVQKQIEIQLSSPLITDDERKKLTDDLDKIKNTDLSGLTSGLAEFGNKMKDWEKLNMEDKINAVGALAQSTITAGFNIGKSIQDIQSQGLRRSIEFQQTQVEESRRIAQEGNAELLQENLKVMDELQKQEREQAESRINLALAEMAAKSLVAIAQAAAIGGPAAAVTIPLTIAAMLAGFAIMKEQAKAQGAGLRAGFKEGGYTGDIGSGDVAGVVHGREFVFTAEQTRANRDIFERIHRGELNLRSELNKASLLEGLLSDQLIFRSDLHKFMINSGRNFMSNEEILDRMDRLERAIREQDRLKLEISERGIYSIVSKIQYNNERSRSIAK